MIKQILVLGGGSAGFLAAITLKTRLPHLAVTVLQSKEIGIIGVGESTTPAMPKHLHGYLGLDLAEFYREVEPTWKLGIRFLWGPRPWFNYTFLSNYDSYYQRLSKATGFYCEDDADDLNLASALMNQNRAFERLENGVPYIGLNVAYHLDNPTFVRYLEAISRRLGIAQQEGVVQEVLQDERGICGLRLESGTVATADLFIDCSGFRSLLLGEALQEPYRSFAASLYCDSAIVGSWDRGPQEPILPYTTAETMSAGWCWRIEHQRSINRGYVFSSRFMSDEEAEREFRAKCPHVDNTRFIRFKSGRYERAWVKNVVAIGNASGFVEPLESTALRAICTDCEAIAETLFEAGDALVSPSYMRAYNLRSARNWDAIRQFLAIHYRFNQRLSTPFWQECNAKVDLAGAEQVVEYFQENGPCTLYRQQLLDPNDPFKMDGYLALLIGQRVPYQKRYQIPAAELATLHRIRTMYQTTAKQAFTSEEALQLIRSPNWQWNADFYKNEYAYLQLKKQGR